MEKNSRIVLDRLAVVTSRDGEIQSSLVKTKAPEPCAQANARGNLRSCTLNDLRCSARDFGRAARAILSMAR